MERYLKLGFWRQQFFWCLLHRHLVIHYLSCWHIMTMFFADKLQNKIGYLQFNDFSLQVNDRTEDTVVWDSLSNPCISKKTEESWPLLKSVDSRTASFGRSCSYNNGESGCVCRLGSSSGLQHGEFETFRARCGGITKRKNYKEYKGDFSSYLLMSVCVILGLSIDAWGEREVWYTPLTPPNGSCPVIPQ